MQESSESITIQDDLRVLARWISESGDDSNTAKLHEVLVDELLKFEEPTASKGISTANLLPLLLGQGAKSPPTSVSQHVSREVREKWWKARKSGYHQYARQNGARPLRLFEKGTRPLFFGYEIDDSDLDFVLADSVIRYHRERVENSELTWISRILYPQGKIRLEGWRRTFHFAKLMAIGILFFIMVEVGILSLAFRSTRNMWDLVNALVSISMSIVIYRLIVLPHLNFFTRRIKVANPALLRISKWDKPDVVWELVRNNRCEKTSSIELVRWYATCPICQSIVDIVNDEPGYHKLPVGRCRESSEHLFSFDRVTGEGRALRARLVICKP